MTLFYKYYEQKSENDSTQVLKNLYENQFLKPILNRPFNQGFTESSFWLAVYVKNQLPKENQILWSFYNNGLKFNLYEVVNNQMHFLKSSSMCQTIDKRPYPVRSISFPIVFKHNQTKLLLVHVVATTAGNYYFPTDITYPEDYLWYEIDFSYLTGKYMGFFGLALIINIMMFLVLKRSIYLYNSLQIFFIILFQLFDFHFDSLQFNNMFFHFWCHFNKELLIIIALIFYLKVFQIFTEQQLTEWRMNVIVNLFNLFLMFFVIVSFIICFLFPVRNSHFNYSFDILLFSIANMGFALLIVSLLIGVFKKKKFYILFLISSLLLIYGFISYISNNFYQFRLPIIQPGNIINGLTFEIASITLLFIYKYKLENEELNNVKVEKAVAKERLAIETVKIQEAERKEIAQELHDTIGGNIAGVKLLIQKYFEKNNGDTLMKETIINELKSTYNTIRTISHQLMPNFIEQNDLITLLKNKIELYKNNITINFQYKTPNLALENNQKLHIYRIIDELILNAIKHSQATVISIQMYFENNLLEITIEYNGIKFVLDKNTNGIGLKNIQYRIAQLNAKIFMESNDTETTYIIEIPI